MPERLWLIGAGGPTALTGTDPGYTPSLPDGPGPVSTPHGLRWFAPVVDEPDLWIEGPVGPTGPADWTRAATVILEHALRSEREVVRLSQELASRYEEIDLLYTISEVLGQTVRLEEAARIIIRAVSSVVGARRASIVVHDERANVLRTVAAQGIPLGRAGVIQLDDPDSVAARVFRERKPLIGEPTDGSVTPLGNQARGYQGTAFMSMPISYAAPGAESRCIGVINLTDRIGGDRFVATDQKLVAAIANQIGAALENARLVERERDQERLERELELAKTLQQGLLPSPSVLANDAQVGVRCQALESVGGDFYTFSRLGFGCVGVMVGDVSSHGFGAALLMASAVSAAGIHTSATVAPDEVLAAMEESLAQKLASSENYLTVFYGMIDPGNGRLTFANAGHPHAFRVPGSGPPARLEATAPPLGLGAASPMTSTEVPWVKGVDLLCVWTDGLADAQNERGERFGEDRILAEIAANRPQHPEAIVAAVMASADQFATKQSDDRTLLVLRA